MNFLFETSINIVKKITMSKCHGSVAFLFYSLYFFSQCLFYCLIWGVNDEKCSNCRSCPAGLRRGI